MKELEFGDLTSAVFSGSDERVQFVAMSPVSELTLNGSSYFYLRCTNVEGRLFFVFYCKDHQWTSEKAESIRIELGNQIEDDVLQPNYGDLVWGSGYANRCCFFEPTILRSHLDQHARIYVAATIKAWVLGSQVRARVINYLSASNTIQLENEERVYTCTKIIGMGNFGVVAIADTFNPRRTIALKFQTLADTWQESKSCRALFDNGASRKHLVDWKCCFLVTKITKDSVVFYDGARIKKYTTNSYAVTEFEYILGNNLESWIREKGGSLKRENVINFTTNICDAATSISEAGFVHTDLKPSNIIVTENGGIKIIDLALATEKGKKPPIIPTSDFAAPEQKKGGNVSEKCDIYSIGQLMRFINTGKNPETTAMPLTMKDSDHFDIQTTIGRAINIDPDRRYATIKSLKKALLGQLWAPRAWQILDILVFKFGFWLGAIALFFIIGDFIINGETSSVLSDRFFSGLAFFVGVYIIPFTIMKKTARNIMSRQAVDLGRLGVVLCSVFTLILIGLFVFGSYKVISWYRLRLPTKVEHIVYFINNHHDKAVKSYNHGLSSMQEGKNLEGRKSIREAVVSLEHLSRLISEGLDTRDMTKEQRGYIDDYHVNTKLFLATAYVSIDEHGKSMKYIRECWQHWRGNEKKTNTIGFLLSKILMSRNADSGILGDAEREFRLIKPDHRFKSKAPANIYEKPDARSGKIGEIQEGDTFVVLLVENNPDNWAPIFSKGLGGWIDSKTEASGY